MLAGNDLALRQMCTQNNTFTVNMNDIVYHIIRYLATVVYLLFTCKMKNREKYKFGFTR